MTTLRMVAAASLCLLLGWSSAAAPSAAVVEPAPAPVARFDRLVGPDDFRISDMGNTDGSAAYEGRDAAIAYNSTDNEYLVVWRGTDDGAGLAAGEFEVLGQRIDAATGLEVGANDFRISDMGPDGNADYGVVERPSVAYNSVVNEYLVVWVGDDNTGALIDDELEVFGQRIDGATGSEVGVNDFRISDMGPDGNAAYGVVGPAAVAGDTADFFVVWSGDDDTGTQVDDEFEIFVQRIDSGSGAEIAPNDLRISHMGPDGHTMFGAFTPDIAVSDDVLFSMVVWSGDDAVDDEFEIFAQELVVNPPNPFEDEPDVAISSTGVAGDTSRDALVPRIGYGHFPRFLVAWIADDPDFGLADDEYEVIAKTVATNLFSQGNEMRISHMGTDGDPAFDAASLGVGDNAANELWLVVWSADHDAGMQVEGEHEIFGQFISYPRNHLLPDDLYGPNGFRISDAGADGDAARDASAPAVAFGSSACEYLTVWDADDDAAGSPALADDELEIFGQRMAGVSFVTLDAYGGVYSHCGNLQTPLTPYFFFDIARDLELTPTGFYVLDGFGGIHLGGSAPVLSPLTPYFGFDIARDLELAVTGFYVLDGYGGVHVGGGATPVSPATPYFGFDIARDLELVSGGYYVLEGFGGVHAGGSAPWLGNYYFGWDAVRDLELDTVGYYTLDAFGFLHEHGGAPRVQFVGATGSTWYDLELSDLTRTSAAGRGFHALRLEGSVFATSETWNLTPRPQTVPLHAGRDLEFR